MYIYFDSTGSIKEIVNDSKARKGSDKINRLYFYFEDGTSYTNVALTIKYPDGTTSTPYIITSNIKQVIFPQSINKLSYFVVGKKYPMYYYDLAAGDLAQSGMCSATVVGYHSGDATAYGLFTFKVEQSVLAENITLTQTDLTYILEQIANVAGDISVYVSNAEPTSIVSKLGKSQQAVSPTTLGENSVELGKNAEASADGTIAIGEGATANAINSNAIGNYAYASGVSANAIGGAIASGDNSNAMGYGTEAYAYATAIGYNAKARSNSGIAIGNNVKVNTNRVNDIVIGHDLQDGIMTAVNDSSAQVIIGYTNTLNQNAGYDGDVIIGSYNTIDIDTDNSTGTDLFPYWLIMGNENYVKTFGSGIENYIYGYQVNAARGIFIGSDIGGNGNVNGSNNVFGLGIGIGYNLQLCDTTATDGSFVIGMSSKATGDRSGALGYNAWATADKAWQIGEGVNSDYNSLQFMGRKIVDYNVNRVGAQRYALAVLSGGTTGQVLKKKSNTNYEYEWGDIITNETVYVQPQGGVSTSITSSISSNVNMGTYVISLGYGAQSRGNYGIALGTSSTVASAGANGIAIGGGATVNGQYGVSLGYNSLSNNDYGVAIGYNAKANNGNDGSVAIGKSAETYSNGAIAIGYGANVNVSSVSAIAIGAGAGATGTGATQLGRGYNRQANTLQFQDIVIADGSTNKLAVKISSSIDPSTYVMTLNLIGTKWDNVNSVYNDVTLSTTTIDLPLEEMVISGSYDDNTESIILTLKSGQTVTIPVSDLVSGLQTQSNILDALSLLPTNQTGWIKLTNGAAALVDETVRYSGTNVYCAGFHYDTSVNLQNSVMLGETDSIKAVWSNCVVIGYNAGSVANNGVAIGRYAQINYNCHEAVALGDHAIANAGASVQLGDGTNNDIYSLQFRNRKVIDYDAGRTEQYAMAVKSGGDAGDVLAKASSSDYDYEWTKVSKGAYTFKNYISTNTLPVSPQKGDTYESDSASPLTFVIGSGGGGTLQAIAVNDVFNQGDYVYFDNSITDADMLTFLQGLTYDQDGMCDLVTCEDDQSQTKTLIMAINMDVSGEGDYIWALACYTDTNGSIAWISDGSAMGLTSGWQTLNAEGGLLLDYLDGEQTLTVTTLNTSESGWNGVIVFNMVGGSSITLTLNKGDWLCYNGTTWQKVDNQEYATTSYVDSIVGNISTILESLVTVTP